MLNFVSRGLTRRWFRFMSLATLAVCAGTMTADAQQDSGPIISFRPPSDAGNTNKSACTITVPVKLTRLHKDVQGVLVVCGLWPNQADAQKFSDSSMRGVGFQSISVGASRNYNGAVKVDIRERPQSIAERRSNAPGSPAQFGSTGSGNPTHWACGLSFEVQGASNPQRPSRTTGTQALKAIGTFRGIVVGKLHKP